MKFSVNLSPDLRAEVQQLAADRELTASAWVRQAILAYMRTNKAHKAKYEVKVAYWPSGYPKDSLCNVCERSCHDPGRAHGVEIDKEALQFAAANPCGGSGQ